MSEGMWSKGGIRIAITAIGNGAWGDGVFVMG